MRLYTHTCSLKNKENEKQEGENINVVESSSEESAVQINGAGASTDYVNREHAIDNCAINKYAINENTINENAINKNVGNNKIENEINNKTREEISNKKEDEENNKIERKIGKNKKRIKKKEGKLQKVSCLLVVRKMAIAAIMIIAIVILAVTINEGIKNKIGIFEKIGKLVETKGKIEKVRTMDMNKVDLVPDKNNVNIPVPKGYVLSESEEENDVTKGAVIYEGTKRVVDTVTDANTQDDVEQAKLTRNQWVWIPVKDVSRIYREDEYGRKTGKLYDYGESSRTEKASNGSFTEPRILTDATYGDVEKNFQQYNLYGYTRSKLYEEMQKNYEQTIESIETYGGFYLGRYEAGNLSKREPVEVQYNTDIGSQTWYTMYNKAQYLGANENVKSMMTYGSLWDEMLMWLIETDAKTYHEVGVDSKSWGNHHNSVFKYYATKDAEAKETLTEKVVTTDPDYVGKPENEQMGGKRIPTGAITETNGGKRNCANNLYDIAGNCWDWTQEGYSVSDRIGRGGCNFRPSTRSPAGSHGGITTAPLYPDISFRPHFNIV